MIATSLMVCKIKMIGMLLNVGHRKVHKKFLQKHIIKESDWLHGNHSTNINYAQMDSLD